MDATISDGMVLPAWKPDALSGVRFVVPLR
jgi:hypothetical protein